MTRLSAPIVLLAGMLTLAPGLAFAGAGATPDRNAIRALIVDEALELGVSPALALAVAHAESYFDPQVESHKGARGVMQVMPATVRGEYALHPDILWMPRYNIRIGLHFLHRLLERYRGQVEFALSYYNGGSRVGDLPYARVIPATRAYVDKVIGLRQEYQEKIKAAGLQQWTQRKRLARSSRPERDQG